MDVIELLVLYELIISVHSNPLQSSMIWSIHSFVITVLSCVLALSAASLPPQGITPLSSEQIPAFKPYTYFASAGYCNPSATSNWTCGG